MDVPLAIFMCLLGATGLMRLGELAVSMRRMQQAPDRVVSEPRLFPLMAMLHVGLIVAPLAEVVLFDRPFTWWIGGPAIGVLVGATLLRMWTLYSIGGAWNVRVVRPDDDEVSTGGPYRWIRHPNYLVVILEIAALPLVHTAWMSAVALSALNALVLTRRIRTEEAELMKVPAWRDKMADKKRLVPGVF